MRMECLSREESYSIGDLGGEDEVETREDDGGVVVRENQESKLFLIIKKIFDFAFTKQKLIKTLSH